MGVLNRTTAQQVFKVFDLCFKRGVMDACELNDSYAAKAFVEKHSKNWTFGVLGDDLDYDWQMFRFQLYFMAKGAHLASISEQYLIKIRNLMTPWCVLPYCMRFYLLGIQEWISYQQPVVTEIFRLTPRMHWDPTAKVKKFGRMDYISYLHQFCYDYRRLPEDERPVSTLYMDNFCLAVFDLTRKYDTRFKNQDEEE